MGRDVAIDASDLPAYANGQRYVSKGGKLRERFSDPDASWGHRSAVSTRSGGGYYGYKLHLAVCARTGLPIAWHAETGRRQESLYVAPLLDAVAARGFTPETCAMGKGYDNNRVMDECRERDVVPVVALRKGRRSRSQRSPTGRPMEASLPWPRVRRARIRPLEARLWTHAAPRPRTRRVRLHADLTILGRLGQALSRAREAVPVAA